MPGEFITSNPEMATQLFKAGFEMKDERKIINGNKTWTFTVPESRQYEFIRLRRARTGRTPRL